MYYLDAKRMADQLRQRVEQEKQRAEQEKQRAEQEKQRAEQEKQRADRAEQLLEDLKKAEVLTNRTYALFGRVTTTTRRWHPFPVRSGDPGFKLEAR